MKIKYKNHHFKHEKSKNIMLLVYALIIGLLVGLVGASFRIFLSYIEQFRDSLFENVEDGVLMTWLWPILFTITGISIALLLVKKYAPEASGSGVHEIEGALDEIRPMRWKRVLPIKFIASLFSLGSGLLLGREGPTIQIGANMGQMVKDTVGTSEIDNNPLVSAGAAAGLASAFNAPLSGIIFIIEEMHGHFRFNFYSVAAIMIGAGAADFVVRALVASKPSIEMMVFTSPNIYGLWLFVLLGLLFSLIGFLFNKFLILGLDFFQKTLKKVPNIFIAIIVGLIIAIIGILSPEMIGGGYESISKVLEHSFTLSFLLFLFLIRMILTIFSYSSGVPGGIFAPLLTLGVIFGMLFGMIMQGYFPNLISHPGVFAIAGMAAIFSSTVRAPLTGLVLAIEMTSNYELILPLIITTLTASVFTTLMGNQPIYTTLLKRTLAKSKLEHGK
ncbi:MULTISPECIES: H(+)/Cl(-) exchange transporter ClcA [unclassified Lentimicrobium]|uniref:H(+)/Cl(-) exchange transporter ClcA n=1 Tax=unclassified Lentimicrobium TaxID=2677434 RepID=UPI001556927C|nr:MULTISPECIES: H(+)/Cl(-) exchange transporter ClcA [unclassified Lentimicrobium]NPD45527.1 H(+)/Cl(-) exchange transporter ClcA [Lentimicrobium sp. S6]NPD84037.1 H(+)/Cl(-) exchange transporter ClcA [Lentimicrobium sp. L6]